MPPPSTIAPLPAHHRVERSERFRAEYPDAPGPLQLTAEQVGQAATNSWSRVGDQVRARAGQMEITLDVAGAIASAYGDLPAMADLAAGRPADTAELFADSVTAFAGEWSPLRRDALSALMTFCIHGPDFQHS